MGRTKLPKPSKEKLLSFKTREDAAEAFNVSVRTVIRWLDEYGEYHPRKGYGPKLTEDQVVKVRLLHQDGWAIKDLAKKFNVTFSSISRIIHGITHKTKSKDVAEVSVVYNVTA